MTQPQSIKEIYDIACQEKEQLTTLNELLTNPDDNSSTLDNSQTLLADLTSTSKVAIWRLMLWIHSAICYFQQRLWFVFKAQVDDLINSAQPGTKRWYQKQALKFQYGYQLTWNGSKYIYLENNAASKIITRCAVIDPSSIVRIKVAKGLSPEPLSLGEYASFEAYMNQIKFAGTNILIVNLPADKLKMALDIYIDPIVDVLQLRNLINAAINDYINNLEFNGVFIANKLIDKIQAVPGVINAKVNNCQFTSSTNPIPTIIDLQYQSVAGYLIIDETSPLDGYFDVPTNLIPVINLINYV